MENKIKKVFLYPSEFSLHSAYKTLLSNSPKGYNFSYSYNRNSLFEKFKNYSALKKLYRFIVQITGIDLSQKIVKHDSVPKDTDLVFSMGIIYRGSKPWVIDILDNPYSLSGYNYNLFIKNKKDIEKKLLEGNCKAVICANESSLNLMKKHFSKKLIKKIRLLRPAVAFSDKFSKREEQKVFQILFMGSTKNPEDFYIKGGLETIKCFEKLSEKYNNLKLVIRCSVPPEVKSQIVNNPKIQIIENRISDEELENLYLNSQVLSCPAHIYMLMSWLESMSHGLPIVALDTYASKDYIKDNINGFLIKPSKNIPYDNPSYPVNVRSLEFIDAIKKVDYRVIQDLCVSFEKLINNEKLRKTMGENNVHLIKQKFSIETRNRELKKFLDKLSI